MVACKTCGFWQHFHLEGRGPNWIYRLSGCNRFRPKKG